MTFAPVRVMFDTNIFDQILEHPGTLELLNSLTERNLIVYGPSKFGGAIYGHGTGSVHIDHIMSSNPKDAEDALIGITADANADILVTNEKDLRKRIQAQKPALEVLCFDEFIVRMRSLES